MERGGQTRDCFPLDAVHFEGRPGFWRNPVSKLKVQRDYYKVIKVVLQRTQPIREDNFEWVKKGITNNTI